MKLLHIDSSILGPHSVSRILTAEIVAKEAALHPDLDIVYRDLAATPMMHLSGAHMAAWQGSAVSDAALGADLATGSAFIDELFAADIIVIGAPMYNFGIPSQLKAWIDRVVVAGKTFRYGEGGMPESLLPKGKKILIASTRGGVYSAGSPAAGLEHQETYLTAVLSFIGLTDITFIRAEGIAFGPEAREGAIGKAQAEIAALAA
ncbi:MAG: FMN-dependent NADH-azoreductase [Acidiphilium sp. 37-64-53]|uniref:FMN-dependent NADH-azoreductase n=1 Tax=Acidiphilium TaxID=522 RepID=UPI000BD28753|nr:MULTISPECIES: FMN-dependent NADH-azoreductase [Acidiphilium]OYW01581.1 MAG: FMN-dependent NADH-azoreductase [Acidiphilium sp. 37-64-53]OZB23746.1 MAG: FMN-dependent NADH-azoreductase [Acidiphilium sp. 34-64-41]HQT85768.1 FMN-dependent NADH-azoreductase [Acidiphilium rubrum]